MKQRKSHLNSEEFQIKSVIKLTLATNIQGKFGSCIDEDSGETQVVPGTDSSVDSYSIYPCRCVFYRRSITIVVLVCLLLLLLIPTVETLHSPVDEESCCYYYSVLLPNHVKFHLMAFLCPDFSHYHT